MRMLGDRASGVASGTFYHDTRTEPGDKEKGRDSRPRATPNGM
jgi:hypothetical protein